MNLLNRYRESNFNTKNKNNSWRHLLIYIIHASQKEIKKQFLVFKSSFEYWVLSWELFDLQMNINLDSEINLLLPLSKRTPIFCIVHYFLFHYYYLSNISFICWHFKITLFDFSLSTNAFFKNFRHLWLLSHDEIFFQIL